MKTDLRQRLAQLLDSEEGQRRLAEFAEKQRLAEAHHQRWVERLWNRIHNELDPSIERLLAWYGSDRYRDREYRRGCEPREELLWILMGAARVHGKECSDEELQRWSNPFTGEILKLGSWIIQVMHGQGSVIRIDRAE